MHDATHDLSQLHNDDVRVSLDAIDVYVRKLREGGDVDTLTRGIAGQAMRVRRFAGVEETE